MTILDLKWSEDEKWVVYEKDKKGARLREDAPEELQESYRNYLRQLEEAAIRGTL